MDYVTATTEQAEKVFQIVQETIKTVYPRYYPKEVVEFFCRHHNMDNIIRDIENHSVGVLIEDGVILGTGCYQKNHITRVYVLPQHQKNGYGTYIMDCLEQKISKTYNNVCLDASLPACHLYEKRGYLTTGHGKYDLENDVVLVYETMEKKL